MESVQFTDIQRVLTHLKIDPDEIVNKNTHQEVKTEPIEMNRDYFLTHFNDLFNGVFSRCNHAFDMISRYLLTTFNLPNISADILYEGLKSYDIWLITVTDKLNIKSYDIRPVNNLVYMSSYVDASTANINKWIKELKFSLNALPRWLQYYDVQLANSLKVDNMLFLSSLRSMSTKVFALSDGVVDYPFPQQMILDWKQDTCYSIIDTNIVKSTIVGIHLFNRPNF